MHHAAATGEMDSSSFLAAVVRRQHTFHNGSFPVVPASRTRPVPQHRAFQLQSYSWCNCLILQLDAEHTLDMAQDKEHEEVERVIKHREAVTALLLACAEDLPLVRSAYLIAFGPSFCFSFALLVTPRAPRSNAAWCRAYATDSTFASSSLRPCLQTGRT